MTSKVFDHFTSEERARAEAREALRPPSRFGSSRHWDMFVGLMRTVIPVVAVVFGVITALWPFLNDQDISFTLARDEVAKGDGKIRMMNMRYVGTDATDRLFRVAAHSGEQDDPGSVRVRLEGISAEMDLDPSRQAMVNARTGIYRMEEATLSLVGGVRLDTSDGYELEMSGAEVNLRGKLAKGQGRVKGHSELGEIEASQMSLDINAREGIFEGGVKMRITPKRPVN